MSNDITPHEKPLPTKAEAWDLTDRIREGYASIHNNRMEQASLLAEAYQTKSWQVMGYDSFDEYHDEEFGEDLQHYRHELEDRIAMVKVLADSGIAKTKIAEILGVSAKTVHRDLRKLEVDHGTHVPLDAMSHQEVAGQRVEEVGHIDDDEPQTQSVTTHATEGAEEIEEMSKPTEDEREQLTAWMDTINFDAMIIPVPTQIIEAEPSEDTPEYFTPRPEPASWSPPAVQPLPPAKPTSYHDQQPEFLEPPLKIEKTEKAPSSDEKHCRTCNCHLLP